MRSTLAPLFSLGVLAFTSLAALAGTVIESKEVKETKECPPDGRLVVDLRGSYVGRSDFERGHDASGDAAWGNFRLGYRIPFEGPALGGYDCSQWYFRVGADYTRFTFDHSGGLPLPNTLQSISAVVAVEYLVHGRTAFLLEAFPGAYFEQDITGDSFNIPVRIATVFKLGEGVYAVAGATYDGFRDIPVFPIVGVRWDINEHWALSLIPPDPRLIYSPNEQWEFWVGGEIMGGGFKTDGRDIERKRSLNGTPVSYSEYRAGAGFTYNQPNWSLEVGAGYAFQRKFDYYRAEEGYETDDGAPFVRVELRTKF